MVMVVVVVLGVTKGLGLIRVRILGIAILGFLVYGLFSSVAIDCTVVEISK